MEGILLFAVSILSLGAVYAVLCLALNIEAGIGGLWDLGIVSFFGVGAYAYTLLTVGPAESHQHYLLGLGLPMVVGVLGAGIAGGLVAFLIGLPTLRLKREYFLITTLAFAEVIRQIYANEIWLTNGVAGIYGLEQPFKDSFSPNDHVYVLFLLFALGTAVVYFFVQRLTLSPFGRVLRALRENEMLAMTAGFRPSHYHIRVFVVAGFFSGVAGAFYVWHNTLIVPSQFSADVTFFVWTAVIIGGIGNNRGALIGGFVFILLIDLLRFIQISADFAIVLTSLRTALVGIVLILVLRMRPEGLAPERPARINVRAQKREGRAIA